MQNWSPPLFSWAARVGVTVAGTVGVRVGVCVAVWVGDFVGVLVGVCVGVLVGVLVGVELGVDVGELVGVEVGVDVGELVGVTVGPTAHVPSLQTPEAQSPEVKHAWPLLHGAQSGPPQSMSLSLPSCMPLEQLVHVPLAHAEAFTQEKLELVHWPLRQSLPTLHPNPSRQVGQSGPPQSVSVSLPS